MYLCAHRYWWALLLSGREKRRVRGQGASLFSVPVILFCSFLFEMLLSLKSYSTNRPAAYPGESRGPDSSFWGILCEWTRQEEAGPKDVDLGVYVETVVA